MKVCSVCNEIVSANQSCNRSDCPVKGGTTATPNPKVKPGLTGRADKAVQAGLDGIDAQARKATRKAVITFAAVALISGLGFGIYNLVDGSGSLSGHNKIDLKGFEPTPDREPSHALYVESKAPSGGFSFEGIFGSWDMAQLRRGYRVYKEVCAACHSLQTVAFRDLEELGLSQAEVKSEAAAWTVLGIDPSTGETILRPGKPADYFPMPFLNAIEAAAANNNRIPPDLSKITQVQSDGQNYVYSLLIGYSEPDPASAARVGLETRRGLYFNKYSPKGYIAMAQPLVLEGQVNYDDGTKATVPQMAADVAAFLTWTAETLPAKRN